MKVTERVRLLIVTVLHYDAHMTRICQNREVDQTCRVRFAIGAISGAKTRSMWQKGGSC
jgi:hypothetical protein